MKAAHKIVGSYLNTEKVSDEFVANFIAALSEFPPWVSEMLAHPIHGLVGKVKFVPTIAEAVEMARGLMLRSQELEQQRLKAEARAEKIAVPLGAYRQMPKAVAEVAAARAEFAHHKMQVIRELGYDPERSHGQPRQWCFDPAKTPADAPWHDPEELAASAKRIVMA